MPVSPRPQLEAALQQAYALHQASSARSCLAYLNSLIIDCRPQPAPFRAKADPWQWALCERLIPAIESVSGLDSQEDYSGPTSFWLTLPRGHDKTSLIGRLMNWSLAFSRLQLDAVAAAADRDQANFIVDKMRTEARLNPWLEPLLYFRNHVVKGPKGSTLKVISADARSNYGLSPDLIICDELTQWPNQANWDSLTTAKRKRGRKAVHIVITNAGVKHTWQWDVLQQARASKTWWVYEAPGPICSWMDREAMEQDRKTMLPAIARQMIDNEWLDPADSCGFVTRAEAEACADPGLYEQSSGLVGTQYVLSIDYGPVKDRTVMAVMHRPNDSERIVVDRLDVLQGSKKNRVPIEAVESWIDLQRSRFDVALLVVDPYQMEATIQKYETRLPVERFEPRGGKANYELAQALRGAVVSSQLAWPPMAGAVTLPNRKQPHTLSDELAELIVKQHSYGYRIDHLPNRHDDRCVAVGMGLLALLRRSLKRPLDRYRPEDVWW